MRLTPEQKTQELFEEIWVLNEKSFEVNERASREKLLEHFITDDIFIRGNDVVGFAFVTERDGPYLMILAVVSGLRKNGIGEGLLREIETFYTLGSEPYITLMCKVENWQAQRLYLKLGYRVLRVVPKYYSEADGLLMRKVLSVPNERC